MSTIDSNHGNTREGPLADVRVLDLGTMFAGPFAATLLGEFGADVIKVELPKVGDPVRAIGPIVKGVSGPWSTLNRNKRCVSLDMRRDRGGEILKGLVARADLVIENFRPGTLEKWGLGYEVLKQVNPRLIMVRISGFGQTGPYAEKAGFGTPATAFSGLTYLQGYPDRPPVSPPWAMADYLTGLFAALAGVMALYHLKCHDQKEGQQVDIALYESVFRILETIVSSTI
jgi:formyl-CoA transferase